MIRCLILLSCSCVCLCVCVCAAATSIVRQLYQFSVERKDKQSNGNESLGNGRHTSVELLPFFSFLFIEKYASYTTECTRRFCRQRYMFPVLKCIFMLLLLFYVFRHLIGSLYTIAKRSPLKYSHNI